MNNRFNGARAIVKSLLGEGVSDIFGYPGGAIMPLYDVLYDHSQDLTHYLMRHEQGAVHAAQGYSRATGKVGVVIVTSGPGATNTVTGIADAFMDSTPLVVISGQVGSASLGTDAFQETHFTRITSPITKWNTLVKKASEIPAAIAKGFYIATSGRPGPVVIDITKSAQMELMEEFSYQKMDDMRSYKKKPELNEGDLSAALDLINSAQRPLVIIGQGIQLSGAEEELKEFLSKTNFPVCSSLLGLSTLESDHENFVGMIGMHGSYAPNINLNKSDLVLGIGVRFDDRLTSKVSEFAPNAKIIHVDIDASEIEKIIKNEVSIIADAKDFLTQANLGITAKASEEWINEFRAAKEIETQDLINKELNPSEGELRMAEVVHAVTKAYDSQALIVTDVGQQQMFAARYATTSRSRSFISSGGLGTMGFGLPASIGAKIAQPNRDICLFAGDGGIQMNIQEFATIMQYGIDVKVVILNNSYLGLVRQWQEMFFDKRYSFTQIQSPDFSLIAQAYNIAYSCAKDRGELQEQINAMINHKGSYILEAKVFNEDCVYPMVPVGSALNEVLLKPKQQ